MTSQVARRVEIANDMIRDAEAEIAAACVTIGVRARVVIGALAWERIRRYSQGLRMPQWRITLTLPAEGIHSRPLLECSASLRVEFAAHIGELVRAAIETARAVGE